jgi:Domain of unknown function (DUF4333)
MRLGVLPMLVAMSLLLAACGDGDESNDNPIFPMTGAGDDAGVGVHVFDQAALEGPNGVEKILANDYKIENIELIDCPADQEVEVDSKFECTVMIGGGDPKELTVQITVTSDDGQYQVALPEEKK